MLFIVPDDSSPNKPGDSADSGTSLDVTLDVEDDDSPAASPGKVELDLDDAPFLMEEEEPEPEPAPALEPKAAAPAAAEDAPVKKKFDFKALLKDKRVLAGAGSALILLGVAAFFLFSSPSETPPPPEPPAQNATAPKEPVKPTEYYIRWEPFWVEFTDAEGNTKFLICRFAGVTLNQTLKAEAEAKQLVLRDTIYYYLTHKDKGFLGDTSNADALKRDILAVVNQYLTMGQLDQVLLEDYVIK